MNPSGNGQKNDTSLRFCFTLDTEPDNLWEYRPVNSFESFRRLPEFHQRLIEAGARPTYLTTSEVVESALGRSALEQCIGQGPCEIGAHFHTWTRDWPFEVPNLTSPPIMAMAHLLGKQIEHGMLAYTCAALVKTLGIEPRSYRGGRWSFGPHTVEALAECGITVDSTMTPGLTWQDNRHKLMNGSDFRGVPMFPQYLLNKDSSKPDPILELPMGMAYFPSFSKALASVPTIQSKVSAVGKRLGLTLGFRWLRPTETSVEDMRAVMLSLKHQGCAVWVFMIHSSEIIPCRVLPTQRDCDALIDRCLGGIRAAIELGAEPATLSEAALWVKTNHAILCHESTGYPRERHTR